MPFHQRFINLNPLILLQDSNSILKQEMKKKHCNSQSKQDPPQHSQMVRRQFSHWSKHIPSEILDPIASNSEDSAAGHVCVSFRELSLRRICRAWCRSLTRNTLPPLPLLWKQIPLLLLPRRANTLNSPLGYVFPLPFPDPHRRPETYALPRLQNTHGRICVGSSHGWLITLGLDSSVSLINPITGDSFDLPPLSSIDDTVLSFYSNWYLWYLPEQKRFCSQFDIIRRAVLSSDPVKDPGFTVLLFFSGLTNCCYTCTEDSTTWRQHLHEPFLVEDVIFFKGVFVAVDLSINLAIFDFTNLDSTGLVMKQQKDILRSSIKEAFLVEAAGKLLLVVKRVTSNRIRFPKRSIRIFEIVTPGHCYRVSMRSLSRCTLFVGHGCSVSVSPQLYPWRPEGRMYFPNVCTMPHARYAAGGQVTWHYAGVYEFTSESRITRKVFAVENRRFAPLWTHLRFFWVTPNLNRK